MFTAFLGDSLTVAQRPTIIEPRHILQKLARPFGSAAMAEAESARDPAQFDRLLRAARGGDRVALGDLLKPLQRIARKLLRDWEGWIQGQLQGKERSSDVTQDAYADAVQHFHEFRGNTEAELFAWFQTILKRNRLLLLRHYRTAKRDVRREVCLDGSTGGIQLGERVPARTPPPDRVVAHAEEVQQVRAALTALHGMNRRVVELHIIEGRSFEDIARQLGCSSAAAQGIHRASIQRLRRLLVPPP